MTICNKSRRLLESTLEAKDPMLDDMASGALDDEDYKYMLQSVRDNISPVQISKDSELSRIEGQMQFLSILKT